LPRSSGGWPLHDRSQVADSSLQLPLKKRDSLKQAIPHILFDNSIFTRRQLDWLSVPRLMQVLHQE